MSKWENVAMWASFAAVVGFAIYTSHCAWWLFAMLLPMVQKRMDE